MTVVVPDTIYVPELDECWKQRTTQGFWGPLRVQDLDGRDWILLEPFSYTSAAGETVHCPRGRRGDFASIPRALYAMIPSHGLYDFMAWIHDEVFKSGRIGGRICTLAEGNALALECMEYSGVAWWLRQAIYRGLQAGSWVVWNSYRRADLAKEQDDEDAARTTDVDFV